MIYFVNLMLIYIWSLVCKIDTQKGKKHFLFLSFVQLFALSTFRSYSVGYDSRNYYNIYISISKMNLPTALRKSWVEPGYVFLNKIAYWIGGEKYWVLWGMCALLVLIPVMYFIYRYSENVFYSVCIYICFGYFYASMNQIRQMMSVSVCLLAFIAFNEKKYIKTAIIYMIALSFHNSAIIFLLFLCVGLFIKYINRWLVGFTVLAATFVYFNFSQVVNFVMRYYGAFRIYFTESSKSVHLTAGFSLYVLVYLPILLMAFVVIKNNPYLMKENQTLSFQLWAIFLAELILILSARMHILGRFAMNLEIFTCTLLPSIYITFSKGRFRQLFNVAFGAALMFMNFYYLFWAENGGGRAGIIPYEFINR